MSYIRLFENLAVLEKWYGMESRFVMEPAVLLLVSLPCTIGIELRSPGGAAAFSLSFAHRVLTESLKAPLWFSPWVIPQRVLDTLIKRAT